MKDLLVWLSNATGLNDIAELPGIPDELVPLFAALRARMQKMEEKHSELEALLCFYKASANAMPNPIFIKNEDLRFVFFNQAYRDFFGLTDEKNIGKSVLDLEYLPSKDRERYHAEDLQVLENSSVIQYETVFHSSESDLSESLYWSKGFRVPETGERGVIGEIVDISEEKKLQRELARSKLALEVLVEDTRTASRTDPGTKLLNRYALADDVPSAIRKAQAAGLPTCAMLMDLDHFKQINDTCGHACGDEVLEKMAAALRASFRQGDLIIRYGGDEFCVFLPGSRLAQAHKAADRLVSRVRTDILLPDNTPVTLSIGITEFVEGDDTLSLLARADEALYLAKNAGRNRIAIKK